MLLTNSIVAYPTNALGNSDDQVPLFIITSPVIETNQTAEITSDEWLLLQFLFDLDHLVQLENLQSFWLNPVPPVPHQWLYPPLPSIK